MRQLVITVRSKLRAVAPQTVALNSGLGELYGHGINGATGHLLYGQPQIGSRSNFTGYAFPPQLFKGYSAKRVAGGAIRNTRPAFPSTSSPRTVADSPLVRAMATVGARQMAGA